VVGAGLNYALLDLCLEQPQGRPCTSGMVPRIGRRRTDDRAHPVGIALRYLLGHPSEERLHLRLGRVHGIALQGGPTVLEAGPGA
jgi:hypothetical protein